MIMMYQRVLRAFEAALFCAPLALGCTGDQGPQGPTGPEGPPGMPATPGGPGNVPIDPNAPLSAMVALSFQDDSGILGADGEPPGNMSEYVTALVHHYANDTLPAAFQFPLSAAATDSIRTLKGVNVSVVAKWFDPLTFSTEPDAPRFGANPDYIAYFGDGWEEEGGGPHFAGDDTAGWVWVNHEYVSNDTPTLTSAPVGQHAILAQFGRYTGLLTNDIFSDVWDGTSLAQYVHLHKQQLGGSWMRVVQDPASGAWFVDRAAPAIRYDATSKTQLRLASVIQSDLDHDDDGNLLPEGVVVGIMGDCAGGQTPWGTVITAEENVQILYGDIEPAWDDNQKLVTGVGFDPGASISFPFETSSSADFGISPDPNAWHNRDFFGYLSEIDVGQPADEYDGKTTPGTGHKKLGAVGHAHWENATFVVDDQWELIPDQPIVLYSGDDRRGGRVFKFVTSQPYQAGMTRAEIRALLDTGTLYVAHLAGLDNSTGHTMLATGAAPTEAEPGIGQWIELSIDSEDIAPNAAALGDPTRTVGAALSDNSWNGLGGFTSQDEVLWALFTASNKIGVMELNRPEDMEWNPLDPSGTPRLYVAFTNHTRRVAIDQDGKLFDPEQHDMMSPVRDDTLGSLFAIEEILDEGATPATAKTFRFFEAWRGKQGSGVFDGANPDNIMIDASGHVWFGTDGNYGVNQHADSLYYLDLDDSHRTTPVPTYGLAFRVVAVPADAEATGPAFSSGMNTLFVSVQHPGEYIVSSWPPR